MKGIIVYKSQYGSTKQYAEWLQEETGFELCEAKRCPSDLSGYDLIVIGSHILAGRVALSGWIRKRWPSLQGKPVLLFLTHITPEKQVLESTIPLSFPADMAQQIKVFPVGGRYSVAQMSPFHRTMIKMVSSLEKNPQIKEELLADRDDVKREHLQPLLEEIRKVQSA